MYALLSSSWKKVYNTRAMYGQRDYYLSLQRLKYIAVRNCWKQMDTKIALIVIFVLKKSK